MAPAGAVVGLDPFDDPRPAFGLTAAAGRKLRSLRKSGRRAEILGGDGGVELEARALVVGGGHCVQERIQVPVGRGGEGLLDEVVTDGK
jgi:hypothetical protein